MFEGDPSDAVSLFYFFLEPPTSGIGSINSINLLVLLINSPMPIHLSVSVLGVFSQKLIIGFLIFWAQAIL